MNNWLLLRGLTRDNRHWGDFPETLTKTLPGIRVITLDLPGNGLRNREQSPLSIAAMVEDCRRMIRQQNITGPVNLLAMSLGAMVAIEWANRYPDEIARSVLINPSLRNLSPFYRRLRPQNYGRLLAMALCPSHRYWEQSVLDMTSSRPHLLTTERWAKFRALYPVSKTNSLRQLIAAARYRPEFPRSSGQRLLLASTQDRLVNVSCSRQIAARYSIPLLEHPTAGHDLPLDDGPWVAERIRHWLATGDQFSPADK